MARELSESAQQLLSRVRETLDSREARLANAFYPLLREEACAARELVNRGLAFYSMDEEHLGLYRDCINA